MIQHQINLEVDKITNDKKFEQQLIKEEKIKINKIKREFNDLSEEDFKALVEGDDTVKEKIYVNMRLLVQEKEKKRAEDWKKHNEDKANQKHTLFLEKQKTIEEKDLNKKKVLKDKFEKKKKIMEEEKEKMRLKYEALQKDKEDKFVLRKLVIFLIKLAMGSKTRKS